MKEKKNKDDNNPDIGINDLGKFIIYIELFILYLFCCSNNYIIRDTKLEIIEKLEIPEKKIAWFGIILQSGRVFGSLLIIFFVLKKKTFNNMQYATAISIFLKSFVFLIYYLDLTKKYTFLVYASTFIQGLCHSLIELFFNVWINHFLFWNLFSLSIAIGASPLSNISTPYIINCDSISCYSINLFKYILVFDLIFFVLLVFV